MPGPVSLMHTTARPSSSVIVEDTCRISLSGLLPAAMACAALTSRLMNTWPRRVSVPRTPGTGARSFTSRARWRISFMAMFG